MARILLIHSGMKGITAAIFALSATMASAASFDLRTAYPSDTAGNPVSVALGEPFYMTAKFHVDGTPSAPYRLTFALPYMSRTTTDFNYTGDCWATWGPFTDFLDTPTTMKVSIESADPPSAPLTVGITATLPATGIEYFSPQNLSGSIGAAATMTRGTVSGLQWYSPLPSTGGFQRVILAVQSGSKVTSTPFGQPAISLAKVGAVSMRFETAASASRVNPSMLRSVTFNSYKSLPSSVSVWLRSETLAQSKSADVASFVSKSLPKTYKTTMKPYDAVQQLFQAVVAKMRYVVMDKQPDAVTACRTGMGDCGFFSALFVAACRNIGVPARAVSGLTLGTNQWHVWAEFYLPGYGWIPCDPTYCDALSPDGSFPLYFGTIPDLNGRVAMTYGFDHTLSGHAFPRLQSPGVWVTGSTKVSAVQPFCSLAVAAGQ
ncbi:MAG TPA: transglutaminase-like domain-containing protein [Fimbriimonadaceae bacterium]|nr:transglutaminase-like domain-containing protein [Fimbriimonadaceae bacterium]